MYDLLNTAIRSLQDVISTYAAGGFQLTKFVSNRIEVLDSIPEEDRRTGMKGVYLVPIFEQKWLLKSTGTLEVVDLVSG